MTPLPDQLPDDIDQLKQMILGLATELQTSERTNERLVHRLNQLLRHSFGRKSERVNPAQLELFKGLIESALSSAPADQPPAPQEVQPQPVPESRPGHGRSPIPAHLPRTDVVHDIRTEQRHCASCGCEMCVIGEEVSEQLDFVPASLYVKRHIRKKYACKQCESAVVIADVPEKPILKGLPGPGLLAHVMVSKYADHLPLHRMEGIFERHGIAIPRSTMCDWVRECAALAAPLCDAMTQEILKGRVINTDDTPVPVQDRSRNSTRQARLWVYVGDRTHPYTVYDYTPTHCRDGPKDFLGDYKSYLQADAYSGYDQLYRREREPVTEVGCWAHARRYFYDAQTTDRVNAQTALAYIARLYEVERLAKLLDDDARKDMRKERSEPILAAMRQWLEGMARSALPKSPMGEAVGYALAQWRALNRYLEQGWLDIDNNTSERALRIIAVGRKNWLFAGSDQGGKRAAVIYSLIASAKRHRLNPYAYLRDIFDRLPTYRAKDIADFLPDRWKQMPLAADTTPEHAPSS